MFSREYFERLFGHGIPDADWDKFYAWVESQGGTGYQGAIGGSVILELTPTSIGTFVQAKISRYAYDKMGNLILGEDNKPMRVWSYYDFKDEM